MNCPICNRELDENSAYCPACGSRNTNVAEFSDYSYEAFISYRHLPKDRLVAKKIQKALEGFRIPKHLKAGKAPELSLAQFNSSEGNIEVSIADEFNGRKTKLGKLFRDEDELPAADSLPDQITQALKRSRFLIVVCTPATCESLWVTEEVKAFASFHGRHKILVALAEGEPFESFPLLLLSRMARQTDGTFHEVPAEPVAADMRNLSHKQFRTEILRLAASLIGCGFDDLRQRERMRRMRMTSIAAAAVASLSLVFGGFSYYQQVQIQENHHLLQVNESRLLAEKSSELLKQGDRTSAIYTALAALPDSSTENNRPFVPEAQAALEDALQLYAAPEGWRPNYSNLEDSAIVDVCVDEANEMYAVLDQEDKLHIYDIVSGKERTVIQAQSTPRAFCIGHGIAILCYSYPFGVFAYDAMDGNLLWEQENDNVKDDLHIAGAAISNSGETVAVATSNLSAVRIPDEAENTLTVFNARTGTIEMNYSMPPQDPSLSHTSSLNVCYSQNGSNLAVAFDSTLLITNLNTKETITIPTKSSTITDLAWINDDLITIIEEYEAEALEPGGFDHYCLSRNIRRYTPDGKEVWNSDATFVTGRDIGDKTVLTQESGIYPVELNENKPPKTALISLNSILLTLDLQKGTLNTIAEFNSNIKACLSDKTKESPNCYIATAEDGIWSVIYYTPLPESYPNKEADYIDIDDAFFASVKTGDDGIKYYLLAKPTKSERRSETTIWSYYAQANIFDMEQAARGLDRCQYNIDGSLIAVHPYRDDCLLILDANSFTTVSQINEASLTNLGSCKLVDYSFSHSNPDKLFITFGIAHDSDSQAGPAPSLICTFDARSGKLLRYHSMKDIASDPLGITVCAGEEMLLMGTKNGTVVFLDPDTLEVVDKFVLSETESALIPEKLESPFDLLKYSDVGLQYSFDLSNPNASSSDAWSDGKTALIPKLGEYRLVKLEDHKAIECDITEFTFNGHPIIHQGSNGARLLGAIDNNLYCFDLPTGKLIWTKMFAKPFEYDCQKLFADNGKMIVIKNAGDLVVIDAITGETISKASPSLSTNISDSDPMTLRSDRYLIMRSARTLFVFDLHNDILSPISTIENGVTISTDMKSVLLEDGYYFEGQGSWLLPYLNLDELIDLGKQTVSDFHLTGTEREALMIGM